MRKLREDITLEYSLGFNNFHRSMRHYVGLPMEELLERDEMEQRAWLLRVQTARVFRTQVDREEEALQRQQRRFARWLGRTDTERLID